MTTWRSFALGLWDSLFFAVGLALGLAGGLLAVAVAARVGIV